MTGLRLKVSKGRYEKVAEMLEEDKELFVTGMGRRAAWYAKRRLAGILQKPVEALPASWRGQDGYYFKLREG